MSNSRAVLVAASLAAFAVMGHPASQGIGLSLVVYRQTFENVASLSTTGLLRLGKMGGGLALEPDPRGGQHLAMRDDSGFALPVQAGDRFSLAFTIEPSDRGSGCFLLGNDRDPQHGFSRFVSIGTDGGVELAGKPTDLVVTPGRQARVELWCCLVASRQMVIEKLVLARDGLPTEERTSDLVLPTNGLFFFRHVGGGTVHLDDLVLARRP